MQTDKILIVFCNCPDQDTARRLAEHALSEHLAACVNVDGGIDSIYRWQGKIETAQEYRLTIKTTTGHYPALEDLLRTEHPYEVPEIIAVPVTNGLPEYLDWVKQCTQKD